jgi:hypothetical protein
MGGYMTVIPEEWRSLLGGPALTGLCCVSILSTTSAGPAATVFDPDAVGVKSPIPGSTLLHYPLGNATTHEGTESNAIFVQSDAVVGMAFPAGSRSVLFFGRHGNGAYCYGTGADCHDPVAGSFRKWIPVAAPRSAEQPTIPSRGGSISPRASAMTRSFMCTGSPCPDSPFVQQPPWALRSPIIGVWETAFPPVSLDS